MTDDPTELPPPLYLVDGEQARDEGFGGDDPSDPRACALAWFSALKAGDFEVVEALTQDPASWGDWESVRRDGVEGWSLTSGVTGSQEQPDEVVYMKLIESQAGPAEALQAFDDFPVDRMRVLTLVRGGDGVWRVHALRVDGREGGHAKG